MTNSHRFRARLLSALLVVSSVAVTGCGIFSFSKAGESDAQVACSTIQSLQSDGISRDEALRILATGADLSSEAADANDDYALLHSGIVALLEAILLGNSLDVAQGTWANVANLCNEL